MELLSILIGLESCKVRVGVLDLDCPPHIVLSAEVLGRGLRVLGAAQPPADQELVTSKLVVGRVPA